MKRVVEERALTGNASRLKRTRITRRLQLDEVWEWYRECADLARMGLLEEFYARWYTRPVKTQTKKRALRAIGRKTTRLLMRAQWKGELPPFKPVYRLHHLLYTAPYANSWDYYENEEGH